MASSGPMPVQSEPYTRGYYVIWSLLSLAAIGYIAYLAFGAGDSRMLRISKKQEPNSFSAQFKQHDAKIGSAMAIAEQARTLGKENVARIDDLEKRLRLLAWKQEDLKPLAGVPRTGTIKPNGGHIKQVMGHDETTSDSVDSVHGAVAHAIKQVSAARQQGLGAGPAASVVGVVANNPVDGSDIIGTTVENMSEINPVAIAAATAALAGRTGVQAKADDVASSPKIIAAPTTADAAKTAEALKTETKAKTAAAAKKLALNTPAKEPVAVKPKPRIASVPLPVRKTYGLKLTSGRSVASLRLTWDLLTEMNRPILGGLKTRYVRSASRSNMPYRLIAGPLRSDSKASQICKKLHKQNINCVVTVFTGRRL